MSEKSDSRQQEVKYRETKTVKRIITVENDRVDNLPVIEKLKLLKEIEEMGDWRGLYEDMYVKFLDEKDNEVRRLSAAAFWDFPDEEHVDMLIDMALDDPDDTVCAECVSSLGRFIYEYVVLDDIDEEAYNDVKEFLYNMAIEPTQPVLIRCRALESLSFDGSDEKVIALIDRAYKDKDLQWKSSAIFSMGRSHNSRWFKTILKEMKSKTRRLQIQAILAAREAYLEEATPLLAEFTQDPDREIRLLAIAALPFTRGDGAIEALEVAATDESLEIVEAAERAIDDYFGLEEEEFSETDKVDVRLGTISDIEILDSSKIQERLVKVVAGVGDKDKKKAKAKKGGDGDEDDEESEDEDPDIMPDLGDDDDDDDDEDIEKLDEDGEEKKDDI